MIFFTPVVLNFSTFCSAICWKRNSLPIRRAGSPLHVSFGPRTENFTPA
jgi:hypothetical protein